MTANASPRSNVIVLGDSDTGGRADLLNDTAAEHNANIVDVFTFDVAEAVSHDDLGDVEAVVMALSQAFRTRSNIWVPFPKDDLGREEHQRRLCLVLQRWGLNLVVGQDLWPCPVDGGVSEVDFALRREVQAVDALGNAALAAAGSVPLHRQIEDALTEASRHWPGGGGARERAACTEFQGRLNDDDRGGSALPSPRATWAERQPALKAYARWLVFECGLTQAEAAREINETGHRTPQGRVWQQATVSALIDGRYDHRLAS